MEQPIIRMRGIFKRFYIGQPNELEILHGIDLDVMPGEFLSIVGPSGSGKSTLMNLIGVLDRPSEGSYVLDGINVSQARDDRLSAIRNKSIGFVFQNFNLIARTNARKNVELPMMYAGVPAARRAARARELLKMVGMADRMDHQPSELSGGQKQRVAIARAMANDPAILLADEPTGALDSATGRMVMDLFHRLNREQGKTIVLITHNRELALETDRFVTMRDGRLYVGDSGEEVRYGDR
ncbi:MAG: ABC transporter ATP-binding protein [Clostridiaceae bacterium]|nr:ABC transporter ATP-binding protein [Clostridiaceae bacterium]